MKSSKKAAIIIMVIGIGLFGYSQYASASQIGVIITDSNLVEENESKSTYDIQLKFENPSLLVLTAGVTDFSVTADDKTIGQGQLEPFTLPPMGNSIVDGMFTTHSESSEETPVVKISGVTKYDVVFTSFELPFVYYPTEEQAREFIHQN